uniref:Nodulin-like domain-containing protein n=1 Tax=Hordeum vulgare subsp. vulgare TaxID=112509 RepID=A0A8I6X8G9_HORVV
MALATYLLVMIVVQNQMELSHPALVVSATALMLILLLPLAVVVKQEYRIKRELEDSLLVPSTVAVEKPPAAAPLQMAAKAETEEAPATKAEDAATPASGGCFGSCLKEMFSPPAQGEDYTILQALIWNYAGRVTAGFVSEAVLARYKFPRPLMLTLVLLLACVGHLHIAFGVRQSLYAASVVIGFCFGAQWPLLLAIISEVFGLKYYSTLYNFGSVASPIGAYALNVRVAGYLYDVEAARQHGGTLDGVGDKTCWL